MSLTFMTMQTISNMWLCFIGILSMTTLSAYLIILNSWFFLKPVTFTEILLFHKFYSAMTEITFTSVFEYLLSKLGLDEFPCGKGSWCITGDTPVFSSKENQLGCTLLYKGTDNFNLIQDFSVTHKETPINAIHTDECSDLINSTRSPWANSDNWSSEITDLRKMAVKNPKQLSRRYIFSYIKHLRFIDRGITNVDRGLLFFNNLHSLVLSANYIEDFSPQNLPDCIQILELYGNEIADLSNILSSLPKALKHLGLGCNKIANLPDNINTDSHALVSFDLSHNQLYNLPAALTFVNQYFPCLRTLLLIGNPLSITPVYRGSVVDTLPNLVGLDDKIVNANEKFIFKHLNLRLGLHPFLSSEVRLSFVVFNIADVPVPEEKKNPDQFPEYPVITRKYFIQFTLPSVDKVETDVDSADNFAQCFEEAEFLDNDRSSPMSNKTEIPKGEFSSPIKQIVKSAPAEWCEGIIEVNWSKYIRRTDLLEMRDFFITGLPVELMEEYVESYPPDMIPNPDAEQENTTKEKKRDKTGSPQKKVEPAGGGKRKKRHDHELVAVSTEYTQLASFHLSTEQLINGREIKQSFIVLEPASSRPPTRTETSPKEKLRKDKGRDKSPDRKAKNKSPPPKKTKSPPPTSQKKKGKDTATVEEVPDEPPKPITFTIAVKLCQVQSTDDFDSFINDEASTASLQ